MKFLIIVVGLAQGAITETSFNSMEACKALAQTLTAQSVTCVGVDQ